MVNSTVDISDYLAILRRRRVQIIVPSALILLISISLAFGLPPVYQSTATVLIEQQEIPQELVQSTVTGYASERVQQTCHDPRQPVAHHRRVRSLS